MENANSRFDPSQGIDQLGSLLIGIYDQYENWAKSKGLNYTVFAILYFVYYREQCTQSDICAFWGFAKQTVSTQCNELMDKGILSIVQDDGNRRRKILTLTEQGRAYARPFVEPVRTAETAAFQSLGEELGRKLVEGTEKFYSALTAALTGSDKDKAV
ncbi:MarR family transcriptional regulator [uncultured Neisseria sp.]|uniref:MarR family winged helix-turn-helix transcriptional regulator n=1 Tax=uncultured Neisseria sp. TaxID=237778 RepID=UPI00260EDE72|nr:MarR family transcriptional regulator [uncultured Neisseria sp.]